MKKLLTVAAALLPLAAFAQYEPVAPAAAAPSYQSRRNPWYIGFGLGTGSGGFKDSFGSMTFKEWNSYIQDVDVSPTNVTLNFKIGATLSPTLLFGFDITAIRSQAEDQGWTSAVQVNNYDAVVTWFPMGEGPFLRGGAGLSSIVFSMEGPGVSANDSLRGFNVLGGAGYALWIGQNFNLTFNLDYSVQKFDGGSIPWAGIFDLERSNFWNLWVGFDWY